MTTPLLKAAEAFRVEAENNYGHVPTKKYVKLREALVKAAMNTPEETGAEMNPKSPCCGAETVWVVDEDPGVQCSVCGEWMEFKVRRVLSATHSP